MPQLKKLPRRFYLRSTPLVAKDLLGNFLVRILRGRTLVARIVETEAYCEGDPASHSFRGRTKRNEVMFRRGGHLYVYFTYGMHFCANVVTREEGTGEAVLIRAVEPVTGIDLMLKNRRTVGRQRHLSGNRRSSTADLTNGPAKVCQALGIGRDENGTDLLGPSIFIRRGEKISGRQVGRSSRVGIRRGLRKQWRFYLKGNGWVSEQKGSRRASRKRIGFG